MIVMNYGHRSRVCLLIFILCSIVFFSCRKEKEEEPVGTENLPVNMLEKVNKLRSTGCMCGSTYMPPVPQLQWNQNLELAAKRHAEDMSQKNYFDHVSPTGSVPIQRAQLAGYTGNYVMENIGKGYTTVDAVMIAWQNSKSHCKAMMDSMHTVMGAAKFHSYWVQELGKF
jgi:uncharacterized protein YkwD